MADRWRCLFVSFSLPCCFSLGVVRAVTEIASIGYVNFYDVTAYSPRMPARNRNALAALNEAEMCDQSGFYFNQLH